MRDLVVRFNAEGPDGLHDRKAPGPTPLLNEAHRAALLEIIECGPTPAIHGVVRWRITDLGQWLWEEFQVSVSPQTLSRVLCGMGLRKLSARPKHHAQAVGAIAAFKNVWPAPSASDFAILPGQSTPTYPVSGHALAKMEIRASRSS